MDCQMGPLPLHMMVHFYLSRGGNWKGCRVTPTAPIAANGGGSSPSIVHLYLFLLFFDIMMWITCSTSLLV
jgi:hypothetical protein